MTERPRTILIVEDDDDVKELMVAVLEDRGYRLLEAGDGQEGLGILTTGENEIIDLIITDQEMPVMDGRKLINEVRALPDHK